MLKEVLVEKENKN